MQPNADTILQAALKLPEDERLLLASRLLETVPDEPPGLSIDDPNLIEHLKLRSADQEGAVPWNQIWDELQRDA